MGRFRIPPVLFCRCGAPPAIAEFCRSCYAARNRSLRRFGGHRDDVLRRDKGRCVLCGAEPPKPHVHHRRPGCHRKSLLATLCAACHARIHRRQTIPRECCPELFLILWAEQHPGAPVQLPLPFH